MRTGNRRMAELAIVAVLSLGMAGCVGGDRLPTLPPTPAATPIFASEEEALAAAEAAYAAYLEMSNLISSEGGIDPERIAPFVTGDFYVAALEGFDVLRENGWTTTGASVIVDAQLQFADIGPSSAEVGTYICVDVSAVDVFDSNGVSVVSPDRPNRQAFEVFFKSEDDGVLTPYARDVWEPETICGDI